MLVVVVVVVYVCVWLGGGEGTCFLRLGKLLKKCWQQCRNIFGNNFESNLGGRIRNSCPTIVGNSVGSIVGNTFANSVGSRFVNSLENKSEKNTGNGFGDQF